MEVQPAGRGDGREIARVLARAFRDDPNFTALFGDARRRPRALARLFGAELREALGLGATDVVRRDGRVVGAAIWYPPGSYPLPLLRRLRAIPAGLAVMAACPRAARPMLAMIGELERHRPRAAHWYLGTVGVDPAAHGSGAGAALLAHGLERVDADGGPAYLETATERNAGWYERLGFETAGRARLVADGGPDCWLMWRPPYKP